MFGSPVGAVVGIYSGGIACARSVLLPSTVILI